MELEQKTKPWPLSFLGRDGIRPEGFQAVRDRKLVKPLFLIGLQQIDNLGNRQVVPVSGN